MPFPFHTSGNPAPKRGQYPRDRIWRSDLRAAAPEDFESHLDDGDQIDRWYLLSPEFDELPESILTLL